MLRSRSTPPSHLLTISSPDLLLHRPKHQPSTRLQPAKLPRDRTPHRQALEAAGASDRQVVALSEQIKGEISLLLSPQLENVFSAQETNGSLLDVDTGSDDQERADRVKIGLAVDDIEEKIGKLNKISRERGEVLKDLKEKVTAASQST